MTLKALMEKRNELLDKVDGIYSTAKTETRSLSEAEKTEFDSVSAEINALDLQIKEAEALQTSGEAENRKGEIDMDKELRSLELFLRKQDGEELRDLQVTSNGSAVIPENVEGTVVKKMEESSPAFAKARKFPSVDGSLKIAKETALSDAGFVGEGANVGELAISLGDVKLTQKRVGAAISLSNQLIHDAAINVVDYSLGLLSRRTAKAVEKSMFQGNTTEQFKGILTETGIAKVTVATITEEDELVNALMDLYHAIHPDYVAGSAFYMSRAFFNVLSKVREAVGSQKMLLQNGIVNGVPTYTLFNSPVIVTEALTVANPVVFGSIEESYGIMIKKGFALQHVTGDTTQALRGSQLLVLDGYMDGATYNEQALAVLKVGA